MDQPIGLAVIASEPLYHQPKGDDSNLLIHQKTSDAAAASLTFAPQNPGYIAAASNWCWSWWSSPDDNSTAHSTAAVSFAQLASPANNETVAPSEELNYEEWEQMVDVWERELWEQTAEPAKDNRGYAPWLLNGLAQLPGGGMVVGGLANCLKKSFHLVNGDFSLLVEKARKRFKRTCANDELLANAVVLPVQKLTDAILNGLECYPGLKTAVASEEKLIKQFLEATLLKIALNLAKNSKSNRQEATEVDFTTAIFADTIKLVHAGFEEISAKEFERLDKLQNVNAKTPQLRALFQPLAKKLLDIALPNGKEDLKEIGWLSGAILDMLRNDILPAQLVDIYQFSLHHTQQDLEKLAKPGGETLQALAHLSASTKGLIPDLLHAYREKISDLIIERFPTGKPLYGWFQGKIAALAVSQDPALQHMRDYTAKNIESLAIRALANLAQEEDNLISGAFGNGLKLLNHFFNENKTAIDEIIEDYAKVPGERNKKLDELYFKPLSDSILQATSLEEDPLVKPTKESLFPALLREFYVDMCLYEKNFSKTDLKTHLLDEEAYFNGLQENENKQLLRETLTSELLAKKSGVETTVDELEAVCALVAKNKTESLKNLTQTDPAFLAKKLNEGLCFPLTEEQQIECAKGLEQFFNQIDTLKPSWEYLESLLKLPLFNFIAAIAQQKNIVSAADRKENKHGALLGDVLQDMLVFLNKNIPLIDENSPAIYDALQKLAANNQLIKVKREILPTLEADSQMLREAKKELQALEAESHMLSEEIRKPYQSLAKDFLALAGNDLKKALPVPKLLQGTLQGYLENMLLPAIFHNLYTQLNESRQREATSQQTLNTVLSNGSAVVNEVSKYIKSFVPPFIETNSKMLAEVSLTAAATYTEPICEAHQQRAAEILTQTFEKLAKENKLQETSTALSEYSQGILLEIFAGIAEAMHYKENNQPHFLLETSSEFIGLMAEHVTCINKIPKGGRFSPAYQVDPQKVLEGFQADSLLHPALIKDLEAGISEEAKKQQRLEAFFIPFTEDLLQLAGITPEKLPVPEAVRQEAWELFSHKIVPIALMGVFKEILKPETLTTLLEKTFNKLQTLPVPKANENTGNAQEIDQQQAELDEKLGAWIQGMVNLVPDFWTLTIFDREPIKNEAASALGQIVRKYLDSTKMTTLLNDSLEGFSLEKTLSKVDEKKLRKTMTDYISKQAEASVKAYRDRKWEELQNSLDKTIENKLGSRGIAIKKFFDKIMHFIFMTVLGPIRDFLIFKVLWFFVDLTISQKSKEIIKDVQMPIHENLLYKLCDAWLAHLKEKKKANNQQQQEP